MPEALWLTEEHNVELRPYQESPLTDKAIRAKGVCSALSHGTELSLYHGTSAFHTRQFDSHLRLFVDKPKESLYPVQIGYEWVGVVTEVGGGVTGFQSGDLVHLPLPHRETQTIEPPALAIQGVTGPLPKALAPERAVFLGSTAIALQAVHDAQIKLGDHVIVFGLGVLGLLAVSLVRKAGASRISAVDPLAKRRVWAEKVGADHVFDPRAVDVGFEVKQAGRAADVAIEFSGSYAALQQAVRSVAMGGLVVAAGFYQGDAHGLNLGEEWLHNRVTMVASMRGWGNAHRSHPTWNRARLRQTAQDLLAEGILCPEEFITHRFPFRQAKAAYALIDQPPGDLLKVILDYQQNGGLASGLQS